MFEHRYKIIKRDLKNYVIDYGMRGNKLIPFYFSSPDNGLIRLSISIYLLYQTEENLKSFHSERNIAHCDEII